MAESSLTETGFRAIMRRLRSDDEFRRQFLSEKPVRALAGKGIVSKEDERRISLIKWSCKADRGGTIDEKLVLCSSSGY